MQWIEGTKRPRAVCRLQTLVNYALKAERELWGLLDGPWDGPSYADHRRTWSSQVRPPAMMACVCSVNEVSWSHNMLGTVGQNACSWEAGSTDLRLHLQWKIHK